MIDNVKLIQNGYYLDLIPNYLENAKEKRSKAGNTFIEGSLRGLHVTCGERNIVINGSWPKFKNGENITTLDIADIKAVEEEINDLLHIDINQASITELEVGASIFTDYPAQEYIKRISSNRHYKKTTKEGDESLTFSSMVRNKDGKRKRFRGFKFYDKVLEAVCNGELSDEYAGRNILRCELKVSGEISRQLSTGKSVTADLLSNPKFIQSMKDRLKQEYKNTDKMPFPNKEVLKMATTAGKGVELVTAIIAAEQKERYNYLVKWVEEEAGFNKKQKEKFRAMIRKKTQFIDNEFDPLIQELDSKINSL